MLSKFRYILDRLQEPGSVRSLVLALFILKGQAVDNAAIEQTVGAILFVVAVISFLMPGDAPRTPKTDAAPVVPAPVRPDANTVAATLTAAAVTAPAVATATAVMAEATGKIQEAKTAIDSLARLGR